VETANFSRKCRNYVARRYLYSRHLCLVIFPLARSVSRLRTAPNLRNVLSHPVSDFVLFKSEMDKKIGRPKRGWGGIPTSQIPNERPQMPLKFLLSSESICIKESATYVAITCTYAIVKVPRTFLFVAKELSLIQLPLF